MRIVYGRLGACVVLLAACGSDGVVAAWRAPDPPPLGLADECKTLDCLPCAGGESCAATGETRQGT